MYTYSVPPEDIGVSCQEEEFDLNQLKEWFQSPTDTTAPEHHEKELKRVPLIQKTTAAADIMDIGEIEEKLGQYGLLCQLYAEASCELTRRSKLSQEEAVRACKVYEPYIQDILQQVDAALAIFIMEKELRGLKGRGHFPIPNTTPHGTRVETPPPITSTNS